MIAPSGTNACTFVLSGMKVKALVPEGAIILPKDRKSTRLNSSHDQISYAVFCLKKKKYYAFVELTPPPGGHPPPPSSHSGTRLVLKPVNCHTRQHVS